MGASEDNVIVPVQMEEADLRRANFWFTLNRLWLPSIVLIYLLGAVFFYLIDIFFLAGLFLLVAAGTPLAALLAVWLKTRQTFSDLKDFQKNFAFTFSETGLETSGEKAGGQMSWDHILKAAESKHSFNLFLQRNFFLVVPKRFIKGSTELNRIREILKDNLGDKAKLQSNS